VGAIASVCDGVKRTTAKASTKGKPVAKMAKKKNPLENSMLIIEQWHSGCEVSTANLEGPQPHGPQVSFSFFLMRLLGKQHPGRVVFAVCLPRSKVSVSEERSTLGLAFIFCKPSFG
jgi:hypothetical protein